MVPTSTEFNVKIAKNTVRECKMINALNETNPYLKPIPDHLSPNFYQIIFATKNNRGLIYNEKEL